MTDCPPRLRGDLSKWLCEINTGVYVGQVNSRVREALWKRICQNLKNGRATMVFSTDNEQRMDFCVHNATWEPVDFDGIKLMRRPLLQNVKTDAELKPGFSKAAQMQWASKRKAAAFKAKERYVLIDLETTGLQHSTDEILELGAIRVEEGAPVEEFSKLVKGNKIIPSSVIELTHITQEMREKQGLSLEESLRAFIEFVGKDLLVGYNISFDMDFLRIACKQCGFPILANRCLDLQNVARRKVRGLPNWKLTTVAEHFSIPVKAAHRALEDCRLAYAVYCKLNEM